MTKPKNLALLVHEGINHCRYCGARSVAFGGTASSDQLCPARVSGATYENPTPDERVEEHHDLYEARARLKGANMVPSLRGQVSKAALDALEEFREEFQKALTLGVSHVGVFTTEPGLGILEDAADALDAVAFNRCAEPTPTDPVEVWVLSATMGRICSFVNGAIALDAVWWVPGVARCAS